MTPSGTLCPDAPGRRGPPVRALLIDFDGTLVDTESASFRSWQELHEQHGRTLTVAEWEGTIGTFASIDPLAVLDAEVPGFDRAAAIAAQRLRHRELAAREPLRPGMEQLLREAGEYGLVCAIVTGSTTAWVREHLRRLGLAARPPVIIAGEADPARSKPAPTLYVEALDQLGVPARAAVALEDSPSGIAAAVAAQVTCIALPNLVTASMNLERANARIDRLTGMGLDDVLGVAGRSAIR